MGMWVSLSTLPGHGRAEVSVTPRPSQCHGAEGRHGWGENRGAGRGTVNRRGGRRDGGAANTPRVGGGRGGHGRATPAAARNWGLRRTAGSGLGGRAGRVPVLGGGRGGTSWDAQRDGGQGAVESVVWRRAGVRGLGEGVGGVVGPVDEVEGGDGAGEKGAAPHKWIVLTCHVRGIAEGRGHVVGARRVGVCVQRDALVEHLLQEQADVERGGDGIGKGERFARAGAATDAVGLVRRPVQRGEAVGLVRQRHEVAQLAAVQGQGGGAGVIGVHVDAQGGEVEPVVVGGDGAGEGPVQGVFGVAGVGACWVRNVVEVGGVGENVRAGDAADPE